MNHDCHPFRCDRDAQAARADAAEAALKARDVRIFPTERGRAAVRPSHIASFARLLGKRAGIGFGFSVLFAAIFAIVGLSLSSLLHFVSGPCDAGDYWCTSTRALPSWALWLGVLWPVLLVVAWGVRATWRDAARGGR